MASTKILITVKTYPTISSKYDELVCTAGFREDGTWVRIYPVSFRKKPYDEQYKKYDWIELDLVKNESDFRPESYRPVSMDQEIKIIKHLDTKNKWAERKKYVLGKIYYNLSELIAEAKDKSLFTSLAVFKPTEILDFQIKEEAEREWDPKKISKLEADRKQLDLFKPPKNFFKVVKKLPYKFSYIFKDNQGRKSQLMIEDWEIGQLYWNCLKKYKGDEAKAINDVRKKYFEEFTQKRDLYLFLGTTQLHHRTSRNPFIIVGTFYPEIESQGSFF